MRQLVGGIAQRVGVRRLAAQPLRVMAVAIVAVARDHVDVVVAVVGQLELVIVGAAIALRRFVVVILAVVPPGFLDKADGGGIAALLGREARHRLHVALADGRGPVAARAQHLRERAGAIGKIAAVVAQAMRRRDNGPSAARRDWACTRALRHGNCRSARRARRSRRCSACARSDVRNSPDSRRGAGP